MGGILIGRSSFYACAGSSRSAGGLHAQGKARRERGLSLFQKGDQTSGPAAGDGHARWLRCFAPGGA